MSTAQRNYGVSHLGEHCIAWLIRHGPSLAFPEQRHRQTREGFLLRTAYLLLEDGRRFDGDLLGAEALALGEVVFNPCMSGYQEVLTDPSYTGQLVTMTYPLIGNYGVNAEDRESPVPQVAGFIVREASRVHSSWRSEEGLDEYLGRHGIPGISDLDTRALTRHLRSEGAMRGAIAPADMPAEEVLGRVQNHPHMEGLDLASGVSTVEPYEVAAVGDERFHVLAYDFGVKAHSPKLLSERGCRVTVIPADTPVEEILSDPPDGLFVSNGPGDPAAVERAEAAILGLAEADVPVFGICLGHQLICRAFGARTFKLPFGHHGGNHPVKFLERQTVEITSQNHGFAVRGGVGDEIPGAPGLRLTHVNLYDGTVEGVEHRIFPVLSVQYHPEAAPGPHDSRYLFDTFIGLMEERRGS
ncbi:MAG TPA: glutamine-hydrolyzing carbamoyl-phosphate synthase small subunit [Gemmatimonadetes bacterium]|nr:glutamine-hydrolyzing carbamoyl-phosphate synthase small subunit [Gemmatimonadota bacterium]